MRIIYMCCVTDWEGQQLDSLWRGKGASTSGCRQCAILRETLLITRTTEVTTTVNDLWEEPHAIPSPRHLL